MTSYVVSAFGLRVKLRPTAVALAKAVSRTVIVLALSAGGVRADDPVSSSVHYTGEIVRILDRRCASCHGDDTIAMPLSTYRQVRDWGRAIREEIVEQRMPPWSAARGHARFRNELALTAREATTILSWLDGGMPRGDDGNLPAAAKPAAEEPADLRLALPPQRVPALADHIVRRVTVTTNLTTTRRVARAVIRPGHRRVLRAAFVFAGGGDRPAQWIGAWLPWQPVASPPAPNAFDLAAGTPLTIELHYRGDDREVEDSPAVDLYFADDSRLMPGPQDPAYSRRAVREVAVSSGSAERLTTPATVWAIVPSADATAESIELTARLPDGSVHVLLWIPRYRPDWPHALALQDPMAFPAGTTMTLTAEPRTASATARLSLLRAAAAPNATRSRTRTPAPPRR